jgi:acetolactate synthase-1/2/3 large subunit
MIGAESLVRSLLASGVDTWFANPGTSEMHVVAALDKVAETRAILGLFEGVVTGAADGYGRMAGKPAATLLHLGPGLANGLANLHNARRAASPIVNVVGDHATYHSQYDAPLESDIIGFARPVSGWIHRSMRSDSVGADGARAVLAAREAPGQIATLIVPADVAWGECDGPAPALPHGGPAPVGGAAVDAAAEALRSGKKTAILMRGDVVHGRGLEAAGRVAVKTGARLLCDYFVPRLRRGAGVVPVERLPYFAEQILDNLSGVQHVVLAGARPPVSFFAYKDSPSWCLPEGCAVSVLAHPHEDGAAALEALAEALGAAEAQAAHAELKIPDMPAGALDVLTAAQIVGRLLPADAIISDESATSGLGLSAYLEGAQPHDILSVSGGAIGMGIPLGAGAAVACPDRKVICLQGDGGGMYTLQALWTQARENLDVTTVIYSNRAYVILMFELMRMGISTPGAKAMSMLDLHNPELNWVSLASGMGVEASRAETTEQFADQLQSAIQAHGPRLIEVII